MAITNTTKPSAPSITNVSRISTGETWASILTTWAAETRTWTDVASFFTNAARVSAAMTNTAKPS